MTKDELKNKIRQEIFPNLKVDIFINDKRLSIEYDKKEIFYYYPTKATLRTNHFNFEKVDILKHWFLIYLNGGELNGKK